MRVKEFIEKLSKFDQESELPFFLEHSKKQVYPVFVETSGDTCKIIMAEASPKNYLIVPESELEKEFGLTLAKMFEQFKEEATAKFVEEMNYSYNEGYNQCYRDTVGH